MLSKRNPKVLEGAITVMASLFQFGGGNNRKLP